MCQLFAINAIKPVDSNALITEFFAHADENPHGWGFVDLSSKEVRLIRSAERADDSDAARDLLARPLALANGIAHIRFATVGQVELLNCHPFLGEDVSGRHWTLVHKGTVFNFPPLDDYFHVQAGSTDSERVLLYLLDKLNDAIYEKGAPLEADERFAVFEEMTRKMGQRNCLNLVVFDSDQFYIYTNYKGAINVLQSENQAIFCTSELQSAVALADPGTQWAPVTLCTPLIYKHGNRIAAGAIQLGAEYFDNAEDSRYLYQDYAAL